METTTCNGVIDALPRQARAAVLRDCSRVELDNRTTLARMGERTEQVHFPETAVISVLATYQDGASMEMANVGREACTGAGITFGHPTQISTEEMQVGGTALVMSADRFVVLQDSIPVFRRVLLLTVQALFYQTVVSGACNGLHSARQRLSRWLLSMHDRNGEAPIFLTQDFLAQILGLRRATVTAAAKDLQSSGLITYSRGRIDVLDRRGLREKSCECYGLVRDAYDTLIVDPATFE